MPSPGAGGPSNADPRIAGMAMAVALATSIVFASTQDGLGRKVVAWLVGWVLGAFVFFAVLEAVRAARRRGGAG